MSKHNTSKWPNWLKKAKISDDADIDIDEYGDVTWHDGTWYDGEWLNGVWHGGTWESGTWNDGDWEDGTWLDGTWKNGIWEDGWWYNGTWHDGTWFNGIWENGVWEDGTWHGGKWENGTWKDGVWYDGTWHDGIWEEGYINDEYSEDPPTEVLEDEEEYFIDGYTKWTNKTAIYPDSGEGVKFSKINGYGLLYTFLGLGGEVGELQDKVKKILRDKDGELLDEDFTEIQKELSDIEWYLSRIHVELGLKRSDTLKINQDKLNSRLERGKLGGSGDNR